MTAEGANHPTSVDSIDFPLNDIASSGKYGLKQLQAYWGVVGGSAELDASEDRSDNIVAFKHLKALRRPEKFAFFLASNLVISDEEKLILLASPTIETRLM